MNYFTPELFVRLQKCESAADFREVNSDWEQAARHYHDQRQQILPRLPETLQQLVSRGSLHDSRVLDLGTTDRLFTAVLQEERDSHLLLLTWLLVDPPVVNPNAFADEDRAPETLWLYDEISIDSEMVYNPALARQERVSNLPAQLADGWVPVLLHSMLLSNGWEIRLRFHQFSQLRTVSLFRANGLLGSPEDSLAHSA